jgi:Putative auto-transporter adhesin, head GIN domain
MKNFALAVLVLISFLLSSCYEEDPGPRQSDSRTYGLVDFDRIEAGDALVITIKQGSSFSIEADGDRRNLDDLLVYKNGTSLVLRFEHYEKRQYNTSINITVPTLVGVDFSGATNAQISGFVNINRFDLSLSGASLAQLDVEASELYFSLSGASQLRLNGKGQNLVGTISGASILSAFSYPSSQVTLIVSGASNGKVSVDQQLDVNASGASLVVYRGNPQLEVQVTGESIVKQD